MNVPKNGPTPSPTKHCVSQDATPLREIPVNSGPQSHHAWLLGRLTKLTGGVHLPKARRDSSDFTTLLPGPWQLLARLRQVSGPCTWWDCGGPTLQALCSGRAGVKARGPCGPWNLTQDPEIVTAQQTATYWRGSTSSFRMLCLHISMLQIYVFCVFTKLYQSLKNVLFYSAN